jgi:hypothetical protein
MQREIILFEIMSELNSSDYLCDIHNDWDQASRECGPDDHLYSIGDVVINAAQKRAHALGYHFTDKELKIYFGFGTEVSTESTVGNHILEEDDDDLPF